MQRRSSEANVLVELADFASSTRWSELPERVRERTLCRVLDVIGCVLASQDSDITRKALAFARANDPGRATYWLGSRKGTPSESAFVNSVLTHSILQDDVGQGGHPGANVIPAAVAVGEVAGARGTDVLAAIAAGYEVQVRLGAGDLLHAIGDRGLRGTTATGSFGAAVAAARAVGLSSAKTGHALSIAASLCVPGIEQPLLVGSDERCLQVGANTANGVAAAFLAQAEFAGASSALAGEAGFYAAYTGRTPQDDAVTSGLGTHWASDSLVAKPYPTAGWNVGPVYATLKILEDARITADTIDNVHVLHTWWHRNTAYVFPGPFEALEQALISCNFAVACTVVYGRYDWPTVQKGFHDERVGALARRIKVDGVATWGFTDGAVTIFTNDGRQHDASASDIPEALIRPRWHDMVTKLNELANPFFPPERVEAIVEAVAALEDANSVTDVTRLLSASGQK